MARTKVILVCCFLAAFAAGGTTGFVVRTAEEPHRGRSSPLDELKLTPEQRDQMRTIWSQSMDGNSRQQSGDQRRAAAEERDKAVAALMTPDQQPKYEQIRQEYERKLDQLSAQRKLAFDMAVERTKKEVLTPEQAKQYEEILKKQRERGFGGPHSRRSSRSRPTSDESNAPRVEE